jgi:hypothetical protein
MLVSKEKVLGVSIGPRGGLVTTDIRESVLFSSCLVNNSKLKGGWTKMVQ